MLLNLTRRLALATLAYLAFGLGSAAASDVRLNGNVSFNCSGGTGVLKADQVANYSASGLSGTLHLELWAFANNPYDGTASTGVKMAQYSLGQLTAQFAFNNISSGAVACLPPSVAGNYYVAMILTEFTAGQLNGGYDPRDFVDFATPYSIGQPIPPSALNLVEYYHPAFNHYFVTGIPDEITKLDNGTFVGWVRTGYQFNVYQSASLGSVATCRFFSTAFGLKSSHFYAPSAAECAAVQRNADWQFEGQVFNVMPTATGSCAFGTIPLYRLYNNGQGAAPNHRYTVSLVIRGEMISEGWIPEGAGIGVVACVPPAA